MKKQNRNKIRVYRKRIVDGTLTAEPRLSVHPPKQVVDFE